MPTLTWALLAFAGGFFLGFYTDEILQLISSLFGGRSGH